MLWVELLRYKKRLWELLLSNQGTAVQVLSKLKLLKFNDKAHLEIVVLISKFINSLLPPVFNNWFTFCSNVHNYETTSSATCKLFKPFCTNLYGKNSITVNAIDAWNKAQTSLADTILKDLTPNKIKTIIMKRMIDRY